MKKEYTFELDLEYIRKHLYEFIEMWSRGKEFNFIYRYDYKFFINNIAKQGQDIYHYSYKFIDNEYSNKLYIFILVYEYGSFMIHTMELIRSKNTFDLPSFKQGE